MPWLTRRPVHERLALVGVVGVVLANAWVSDDAYITLRTVEHAARGEGLVWNPGERVQAYTHPLWMAALVVLRVLTQDAYVSVMVLGVGTTALALLALARGSRSSPDLLVALGALVLSKSFVHYGTSGLENPATALLAAWMTSVVARRSAGERTVRQVLLLGALVFLNRVDASLLVAPLVLVVLWRERRVGVLKLLRATLPGVALLLAWETFSFVYYGSFVPNTAYAKLGAGLDATTMIGNGIGALGDNLRWDPSTLTFVGLGGLVALLVALPRARLDAVALVLGAWAYVAYFVWIGGDFMNGRFFMAPTFVVALGWVRVAPLASFPPPVRTPTAGALAASLLIVALLGSRPPLAPIGEQRGWSTYGVTDEQAFYWSRTGLFAPGHGPRPRDPLYGAGQSLPCDTPVTGDSIGFYGFGAGNCGVIVDRLALSDPLIARLPALRDPTWRVGHYLRAVPDGYLESVRTGTCAMRDEDLCTLFDHLQRVTRAPLFSEGRFESIAFLTFGEWRALVDDDAYRRPELVRGTLPLTEQVTFGESGALLEGPVGTLRLRLSGRSSYVLSCRAGREVVATQRVDLERWLVGGEVEVECPAEADGLLIEASSVPRCCATYQARPVRR
jgi:arabinofuranosyltransferase